MILFSQRCKLGVLFDKYCEENNIECCATNMVTWLYSLGLLDEEKVKEYLQEEYKSLKEVGL